MSAWMTAFRNTDSAPPRGSRIAAPSSNPKPAGGAALAGNSGSSQAYDVGTLAKSLEDAERQRFNQLVNDWIVETRVQSSTRVITARAEFNELRAMGKPAAKFALERMSRGDIRLHWFLLLKAVSGQDPVPPPSRGVIAEMADAWLRWGRSEMLIEA